MIPPVVLWTGAALLGVHLGRQLLDAETDTRLVLSLAFIPARYGDLVALIPGGAAARFWTPVTHAFLHADMLHLAVNLVWMASFGTALARRIGAVRFLLLSAAAAAGGAAVHFLAYPRDEALVIGASGAVSGMMAGAARFAFVPGGPLSDRASPDAYRLAAEPLRKLLSRPRALAFILVWMGMNVLVGAGAVAIPGASGPIAWQAHIGGFLAGLLLFPLFDPVRGGGPPDARLASESPRA